MGDAGEGDDAKAIASAMDSLRKLCADKAIMLFSNAGGKLAVLALVPDNLKGKISAKDWCNKALDAVGGKGGGNDATARGQAADPASIDAAVSAAKSFVGGSADK